MELALALGAAVLAAAVFGWVAHLVWSRLTVGPRSDPEKLAKLSTHLAEVEEARDAAAEKARATETALRDELEETSTRLSRELAERQAELDATMEMVGELRRRIETARGEN